MFFNLKEKGAVTGADVTLFYDCGPHSGPLKKQYTCTHINTRTPATHSSGTRTTKDQSRSTNTHTLEPSRFTKPRQISGNTLNLLKIYTGGEGHLSLLKTHTHTHSLLSKSALSFFFFGDL